MPASRHTRSDHPAMRGHDRPGPGLGVAGYETITLWGMARAALESELAATTRRVARRGRRCVVPQIAADGAGPSGPIGRVANDDTVTLCGGSQWPAGCACWCFKLYGTTA